MKLSPLRLYTMKLAVFSAALAYLAVDLWWWQGPVWLAMYAEKPTAPPETVEATVFGESITTGQAERYAAEQELLTGVKAETVAQKNALLMDAVRRRFLRIRTRYNDKNLPQQEEEARAEVQRLASRAANDTAFEQQLQSQGYRDRADFTAGMTARLRQRSQLERAIAPHCEVTDEDVARHYELLKDSLIIPENRSVKHIFLPTAGRDAAEVHAEAEALLGFLRNGADFAEMAKAYSGDESSRDRGGDLGIIPNNAQRSLPELPLFGTDAIPADTPTLAQSRWGQHIILAGEISPARTMTQDECRESLRTAIISAQREIAVNNYFQSGVREGIRRKHILIHAN